MNHARPLQYISQCIHRSVNMYAYILLLLAVFPTTSGHPCDEICCYHDDVVDCFLDGTGFDALSHIATNVTKLRVTRNQLRILEQPYFRNFIHLIELVLDFNTIGTVNYSAFEGLERLENISLAHNEITTLEDNAFRHCHMLKNIDLSYNPILELRGVMGALEVLRIGKLKLSNLQSVTKIGESDFSLLAGSQLKELDLSWCSIEEIDKGAFEALDSLEHLSLSGNKLDEEDLSNAFFNMSSTLGRLDLYDLQLRKVPLKSLELLSSTRLRHLDLGRNLFRGILNFPHLPYLEQLYVKDGRLSSFYTRVVHINLTNLWEVDLSNNLLRYIDFYLPIIPLNQTVSIPRRPMLTHLHLRKNKLSCKFVHEYLSHMTSLEFLDLSDNCLCDIARIIVNLSPKIIHLNLSRNGIESWSKRLNLKNLKTLLLQENPLNIVTDEMLQDFRNLATLDVSVNPFNCDDCNVAAFGRWLNDTDIGIEHKDQISCEKPEELYGVEVTRANNPAHCIPPTVNMAILIVVICSFLPVISLFAVGWQYRWHIRYHWWHYMADNSKKKPKKPQKSPWLYNALAIHSQDATDWIEDEMIRKLSYLAGNLNMKFVGHLPAGGDYIEDFTRAVENSEKIVLLLDNEFLADNMCQFELNFANFHIIDSRSKNGMIIILLEDIINDSRKLKYLLETRKCLKWNDYKENPLVFWAKLKYYLEKRQEPIPKEDIPINVFV